MKRFVNRFFLILALSACYFNLNAQSETVLDRSTEPDYFYLTMDEVLDGTYLIPAPPQPGSISFEIDEERYIWGKMMRNDTARANLAIRDADYTTVGVAKALSQAFGCTISADNTPELFKLMDNMSGDVSYLCSIKAKNYYKRMRPFVLYDEPTLTPDDEIYLRDNGSYPSGHTIIAWANALVLAEINPERQTEILQRGYDMGTSRVICGVHWQSDVDNGRVLATTIVARLHANEEFQKQLQLAKQEFATKRPSIKPTSTQTLTKGQSQTVNDHRTQPNKYYLTTDEVLNGTLLLPEPPQPGSLAFKRDVARYKWGKMMRNDTARANLAIRDANISPDDLAKHFSNAYGMAINADNTPELYKLLTNMRGDCSLCTRQAKKYYMRMRPFALFDEPTLTPKDEKKLRTNGSYPSGHTVTAWTYALVLAEINPARQTEILQRGYDMGTSRVICGVHWQSDVDNGRILASTIVARLHANAEFQQQMAKAKKELSEIQNKANKKAKSSKKKVAVAR